jgi:outer membrane protein assembly factor BamB
MRNRPNLPAAIAVIVLLTVNALGMTPVPPKAIIAPEEVLWFAVNDSNIVAVLENGTVGVWNYSGELQGQFKAPGGGIWALSRTEPALLVNAAAEPLDEQPSAAFYSKLVAYDLDGNEKSRARFELLTPCTCVFPDRESTVILTSPAVDDSVIAVGVIPGVPIWRARTDVVVGGDLVVLNNGKCYANFCKDNVIRARQPLGKLLWRWRFPKDKLAEPAYWPENAAAPYVVVYESNMEKDEIADYVALSAAKGKPVWRLKNVKYDSLKAVSDDGREQFLFQRGHGEITSLPHTNSVDVAEVANEPDAQFSPEGRFLFCLPMLAASPTNEKENTYVEARKSETMQVVDVETGRIVTQFKLTPSTQR